MHKFTTGMKELGYYVYLYVDPRTSQPFYVGKGTGNRVFSHLSDKSESPKVAAIAEITAAGEKPRIELLAFGLDEKTAFKLEAAAIDLIGFENLTNKVVGHGANKAGRMTVEEVQARLAVEPIDHFDDPCVLIKLTDSYPDSAARTDTELYDATRGMWSMNIENARERAKYALAVYGGIIREVYEVSAWLPAGTTLYLDAVRLEDADRDNLSETRIEFVGRIAPEKIRKKYIWKSVAHHYKKGSANPVKYVGPSQH